MRDQVGTVEISAAHAMNWLGGVQTSEAAIILHNQGGIAVSSVRSGDRLQAAQQGATVNPAQGWVQNLNQAAIASQLNNYLAIGG